MPTSVLKDLAHEIMPPAEELTGIEALSLLQVTAPFYWEQDEQGRFTKLLNLGDDEAKGHESMLGKARWELGCDAMSSSWDEHRRTLDERRPYHNFITCWRSGDGSVKYVSSSGRPTFDADGRYIGYRGVSSDVTDDYRNASFLNLERQLAAILVESADFADVAAHAIELICESQGWDAGAYWTVDRSREVLRRGAEWRAAGTSGAARSHAAGGTRAAPAADTAAGVALDLAPGEGLAGTVWLTAQPLWIPELRSHRGEFIDLPIDSGSALLFPVSARGSVVGVFSFTGAHIDKPDTRLRTILQIVGVQIETYNEMLSVMRDLGASKELYSNTFDLAAIGISHVSRDGRFLHVNSHLCNMLGYTREELLALTIRDVSHPEDAHLTDTGRWRLHSGQLASLKREKRYIHRNGRIIWVRITAVAKQNPGGSVEYDISIVEDISERKAAEARIQYLATHDDLTAIPNRDLFTRLLDQAIATARRTDQRCAVLFVDLDRFKIVNDSLGHDAGDILLKETAARLKKCLREGDVVARFGGDEFVILLEALDGKDAANSVATKILSAVLEPIPIKGHECRVTASIGIACYPDDAPDAESLIKHADTAMYTAKERGKNNAQSYSVDMNPVAIERLTLESQLRRALERDEFTIHYQPKVDTTTNRIVSVEALLRWWNHELGTVSPARFVPLAEETGLIIPIGKWVLQRACEQNIQWQRRGLDRIVTAVNLSPRQFNDAGLLADITEVLERTGIDPSLIELEITESAIMSDVERALEIASSIKRFGIRLAIDDFGTGYSSLAQLKRFPVDTLKIDRSFVRDIPEDVQDRAITEAIISLGRTLGVRVVAEGVETIGQLRFVRDLGCHEVQGFIFGKPCHPDALAGMLAKGAPQGEWGNSLLPNQRYVLVSDT